MPVCNICELNLASAQTLKGHMENIHGVRVEDKRMKEWSDGSTYGSDDSMESAVPPNTSFPEKGNSIEVYSSDDSGSDHTGDGEDDDSSDDGDSWLWVMEKVIESKNKNGKFSDLVKGSKWNTKKVIKALRNEVENLKEKLNKIECSDVYQKIEEEKGRLEDLGGEENDAIKQAWANNYYLIKRKVIDRLDKPDLMQEEDEDDE